MRKQFVEYNEENAFTEEVIMRIGIIGGGASGMAAALAAAENETNQIILLERQARLGRKLQATGNGRCNMTNLHAVSGGYHGDDAIFAQFAISQFPPESAVAWFASMGLYTVAEESGRVYPYSDQANSVVDILRFALDKPNIEVITGAEVEKARWTGETFQIDVNKESFSCDRLIVACGGLAGTKLGGGMSGYKLLRSFGHRCTRLRPNLVQLKSSWSGVAGLKGVRANCHAQILHDGEIMQFSTGEIQFTEYGLSGPVIFEISRDACYGRGEWTCRLDFLPNVTEDKLYKDLILRKKTNLLASELFTGILHNRLGRVLTQAVGIRSQALISDLSISEIHEAVRAAKAFDIPLTEPMGMDSAQVTAGGISTSEFNNTTMESNLVPGLYACGEVLDIDGDCGGYNLQWAWSSGRLAGLSAGRVRK